MESGKFCNFEEICPVEECVLQKCGPRGVGKIPSHFPDHLGERRLVFTLPDCGRVMALGWVRLLDSYLVLTLDQAILVQGSGEGDERDFRISERFPLDFSFTENLFVKQVATVNLIVYL